ncbi:MAG: serine/threonine protein kinase [Acidobacteriota bacterium]
MPRLSVPLLVRVALALGVVGLLPFLISAYQIRSSRAALVDQAQLTHKTAARAMADRVEAYLQLLKATAELATQNPDVYRDPTTAAAESVLRAVLETRDELIALGIYLETPAATQLVRMAVRTDLGQTIDRALALGDARRWVATRQEGRLRLRLRLPLDRTPLARDDEALTVVLVADATPMIEQFLPTELGSEADLVLADRGGALLAGNTSSLDGFPPAFSRIAETGQLASVAGEYPIAGQEPVVAAYADVGGSPWFVASKQPSRIAESASRRLRRIAWQAFALALILTGLLVLGAQASIIRPIRQLVRAQRDLAGLGRGLGRGGEIEQLQEAFTALERNIHDRDALSEVFLGRYQIRDVLGKGAMGTVFRGWDPRLERPVALKTLRIGEHLFPQERQKLSERLVQEALTLARLQHANIVTVYDVVQAGEDAFIAMELIEGQGLDIYLSHEERLPVDQVVTLGEALLRALDSAHQAEIVHHDLKPANILLGSDGSIKLTDFGISELLTSAHQKRGEFVCGTPGYLAPEALLGESYTERSDLFAIGVVLYQCATGRRPFQGETVRETLVQTVQAPVAPLRDDCPELPGEVERLILALLEKKPEDRPRDARSSAEILEDLAARHGWRWRPEPFGRDPEDIREELDERHPNNSENHLSILPTSTVYR